MIECLDCGAQLQLPDNAQVNEIVVCPDCGMDYVVVEEDGELKLVDIALTGEDWGE